MGGQIASTATSGNYTIPDTLTPGFYGWIVNTNAGATMGLTAPTGCSFNVNATSTSFPAGATVYVQNINGWIVLNRY